MDGKIKAVENKEYKEMVKKNVPKTKFFKTTARAFVVGGIICCIGQFIFDLYSKSFLALSIEDLHSYTTLTIIAITSILTAIGVYDKVGSLGGAGSFIPITGFTNAVVSASIEHNREGIILGLCANTFSIAGPVIVFGISSSIIVGILTMIFGVI